MINQVILTGTVCNMYDNANSIKLVIAQNYKDKATYIPIFVNNNAGMTFIARYVKIGSYVSIIGTLGIYKNNQGHDTLCIYARTINFEGYRRTEATTEATIEATKENTFEDLNINDDDLPF